MAILLQVNYTINVLVTYNTIIDFSFLDYLFNRLLAKTCYIENNYFQITGKDEDVLAKLGNWKVVYEAGMILWIIFGLGYLFMIISIITGSYNQ